MEVAVPLVPPLQLGLVPVAEADNKVGLEIETEFETVQDLESVTVAV